MEDQSASVQTPTETSGAPFDVHTALATTIAFNRYMNDIIDARQDNDAQSVQSMFKRYVAALRERLGQITKHPTVLVSVTASLIVASRLWYVSGRNPTTLVALVDASSMSAVVIGSLAPLAESLAFAVALVGVLLLIYHLRADAARLAETAALSTLLVGVGALGYILFPAAIVEPMVSIPVIDELTEQYRLNPFSLQVWGRSVVIALVWLVASIVVSTLGAVVYASIRRRSGSKRKGAGSPILRVVGRALTVAVWSVAPLYVLLSVVTNDQPWLPAERILFQDGTHVVGYVVNHQDNDLVVLTDADRIIARIDVDDVDRRQYCSRSNDAHAGYIACESPERAATEET